MVTTHASSLLSDSADLVSAARAHWWVWSSKIAFSALGKPGGEDADPQRNDNAFWWMPGARWRQQLLATESHRPSAAFQPVSPHRTLCQALPKAVSVKRCKDPFPASLPFLRAKAASVLLCVGSFSGSGSHSLRKSASHTLPFLHSGSLSPLTFQWHRAQCFQPKAGTAACLPSLLRPQFCQQPLSTHRALLLWKTNYKTCPGFPYSQGSTESLRFGK